MSDRRNSAELARFQQAFDRVKEFPDFRPDERAIWLEFRQAAEKYLARFG